MQSITPHRTFVTVPSRNIQRIALGWMLGGTVLTLAGCVSQQTYESARHEAKARSNELAQAQAEIQSLEQQRDGSHMANQRDERMLANLKSELSKIHASFDQIRKTNQSKLTVLQHNIAALRARHQAMLKEIAETKRYEKRLEALTAQYKQEMAATPVGPEAHMTTVEGSFQEHMVAVITPQSPTGESSSMSTSAAPTPAQSNASPAAVMPPTAPLLPATTAVGTVSAASSDSPKTSQASVTSSHISAPSTPQDDWFSSMTEWLTSLFDWLWT
ncbi:MAG: hypothetical protein M3M98_08410 [Nitrospirota bacterium]|nr:hypothetical protein [Nitrospirota bacterium]